MTTVMMFVETDDKSPFYFPMELNVNDPQHFIDSILMGNMFEEYSLVRIPSPGGMIPVHLNKVTSIVFLENQGVLFNNPVTTVEELGEIHEQSNQQKARPREARPKVRE